MKSSNGKSKKNRRQYTDEFKKEAVRLSEENGCKATAADLGIAEPTLSKWRKIYLDPKSSPSSNEPTYADLLKENRRLKKEMGYLKDINEVLKKSTAIFSNDHLRGKK
ncbi:MAG: transposase [Candidatus Omnitrophica bacterium]|nr:transposase [Candidatus Omnitrophota bacterium]